MPRVVQDFSPQTPTEARNLTMRFGARGEMAADETITDCNVYATVAEESEVDDASPQDLVSGGATIVGRLCVQRIGEAGVNGATYKLLWRAETDKGQVLELWSNLLVTTGTPA